MNQATRLMSRVVVLSVILTFSFVISEAYAQTVPAVLAGTFTMTHHVKSNNPPPGFDNAWDGTGRLTGRMSLVRGVHNPTGANYSGTLHDWSWDATFRLGPGTFGCEQIRTERASAVLPNTSYSFSGIGVHLATGVFAVRVRVVFSIETTVTGGSSHTRPNCVPGSTVTSAGSADYDITGVMDSNGIVTLTGASGAERFGESTHTFFSSGALNPVPNLTGTWIGIYQYQNECLNYRGQQTLVLLDIDGKISGTVADVTISPVAGTTASGTIAGSLSTLTYSYDTGQTAHLTNIVVSGDTMTGVAKGICGTNGAAVTLVRGGSICEPEVAEVIPNQAVDSEDINGDGRIDVVAGRTTLLSVKVTIPAACTTFDSLALTAHVGSWHDTRSNSMGAWRLNPVWELTLMPDDVPPGDLIVTFEANRPIKATPWTFDAKPIRALRFEYYKLDYLAPNTLQFSETVNDSADFIEGVFPVPEGQLISQRAAFDGLFVPVGARKRNNSNGYALDVLSLYLLSKMTGVERVVGIVPDNYFTFYGLKNWFGVAPPTADSVVLVKDQSPRTTAHEIGHTYGLPDNYVVDSASGGVVVDGVPIIQGFNPRWVQHPLNTFNLCGLPNSGCTVDYMGTEPPGLPYPGTPVPHWTLPSQFTKLFQQFRASPVDPPVLLVTGIVYKDGTAEFDRIYRHAEGVVSTPSGDDAAIRVLDATGNVLSEIAFGLNFVVGDPSQEVDHIPFGFSLPDLPGAVAVEIVRNGFTLVRQPVVSGLLQAAVDGLPDAAFAAIPQQRRSALLNKIEAFNRQLMFASSRGARMNLFNDIRKSLEDWLQEYQTLSPLQYSKAAILALVDSLATRLQ